MKAVGINTDASTSVVATIGPVTSFIALVVAATGDKPSLILRSTFSTTTMASSTTIPMANTRPNSDRAFNEKPMTCIKAKVPIKETGTATSGIIEARQVCRNSTTTTTTSKTASSKVFTTASIEPRTNTVGS